MVESKEEKWIKYFLHQLLSKRKINALVLAYNETSKICLACVKRIFVSIHNTYVYGIIFNRFHRLKFLAKWDVMLLLKLSCILTRWNNWNWPSFKTCTFHTVLQTDIVYLLDVCVCCYGCWIRFDLLLLLLLYQKNGRNGNNFDCT